MSACPGVADWEAFAQEACGPESARALSVHLESCPACQARLDEVRANDAWLAQMRSLWDLPKTIDDQPVPIGKRIGRYEITGLLGSGGMATVYSARQDNPQRTVALKVLRRGLASPAALRRLEHEAELLGRLQHPGIGRIYDAGYADFDGARQPFFAMELVEGQRLTEFAERNRLATRQLLELMVKVGEAVHFAHQKGVIHRDLKPSNILVAEENAEAADGDAQEVAPRAGRAVAQPKILDFGVARCTDSDLQTTTLHTDVGQLIGTIPYMSPEQAAGAPSEIDVRSDVYALGVITYELLTGRLPYEIRDKSVAAAVRMIRDEEPAPLSQTNKTLRGDVQTIVAKALEKDKARRYNSASAFVADIRRFLNDEPIAARPPSATYQLAKFAKRNKALVTGVAGLFLALLAGLVGTGFGLLRATAERNRALDAERVAETRRTEAETVIHLLTEMLGSANPNQVKGADYTVRQLLDDFAKGLDGRFPGQPEVEATIRAAVGNAYRGLGLRPEGETHLKAALELRRQALGSDHPDVARSLVDYAGWLKDNAELPAAERAYRDALRIQRALPGPDDLRVATTLNGLADVMRQQQDCNAAEPFARQALALRRKLQGPNHADVAESLSNLGCVLRDAGRFEEAKSSLQESLTVWRRAYGQEHPDIARALHDLAATLQMAGEAPGAEALYQEALAMRRKLLGDHHHDVAMTLGDYAGLLSDIERYADAEPLFREAVAIQRRVHGDHHTCVACNLNRLCVLLFRQENHAEAESVCREAMTTYEALEPQPQSMTQLIRTNYALVAIGLGNTKEAVEVSARALAEYREQKGDTHCMTAMAERVAGFALLRNGDAIAGESLLRESLGTYPHLPNVEPWVVALVQSDLAECLIVQGRFAEAEPLLTEAYDALQKTKGPRFAETRSALRRLVLLHGELGRLDQAQRYRDLLAEAEALDLTQFEAQAASP